MGKAMCHGALDVIQRRECIAARLAWAVPSAPALR
jgi:hypothetical protein